MREVGQGHGQHEEGGDYVVAGDEAVDLRAASTPTCGEVEEGQGVANSPADETTQQDYSVGLF